MYVISKQLEFIQDINDKFETRKSVHIIHYISM